MCASVFAQFSCLPVCGCVEGARRSNERESGVEAGWSKRSALQTFTDRVGFMQ